MEEFLRLISKPHLMARRRGGELISGDAAVQKSKVYCSSFETRIGQIYVASTEKGVCKISIPRGSKKDFIQWLKESFPPEDVVENKSQNKDVIEQLNRYFTGKLAKFTCDIDVNGTPFQLRVWKELSKIPYGVTTSYKHIAKKIGVPQGAQAVGQAVGSNPLPVIIPCHRVTGVDGALTGYASGIKTKEFLLRLEGALLL